MDTKVGDDAVQVQRFLWEEGIPKGVAKKAIEISDGGRFTRFSVVDALTRLSCEMENAGERTAADQKVSCLLELAAAASRSPGRKTASPNSAGRNSACFAAPPNRRNTSFVTRSSKP